MEPRIEIFPDEQKPNDDYDDGNIPQIDLSDDDVSPDDVPRTDGPGGE